MHGKNGFADPKI